MSGPTASSFRIAYLGGSFTVNPARGVTPPTNRSTLPLTGESTTVPLVAAAGLIVVVLGVRRLGRRRDA